MLEDRDIQMIAKLLDVQKQDLRGELLTMIESEISPKLQLLAEGQDAILEKVAPA